MSSHAMGQAPENFFVRRPIVAIVISIVLVIFGVVSLSVQATPGPMRCRWSRQ
jgi:hypothetical protein